MARKKSLFDDRPEEILRLTMVIKQDINVLNKNIGQLQQVIELDLVVNVINSKFRVQFDEL